MAVGNYEGAVVLRRDEPGRGIWLGPQADCRHVAVSPDGRYVLTQSHNFYKDHDPPPASVWDARSGRRLKDFDRNKQIGFAGNGLSLLAGGQLWRLGSWERGPTVNVGGGDFAEGAGLLACGTGPVVSLVSVATGREVARLEDPNQEVGSFRCFTPDGTRLFTTSSQSESIHAWDLRLIRRRLDELGLDWEAPPFPPEAPRPDPPPRRLVIDYGSMEPYMDDPQRLLTRYSVALAFRPRDAEALHRRALVRIRLERWDQALADAQAAAELARAIAGRGSSSARSSSSSGDSMTPSGPCGEPSTAPEGRAIIPSSSPMHRYSTRPPGYVSSTRRGSVSPPGYSP